MQQYFISSMAIIAYQSCVIQFGNLFHFTFIQIPYLAAHISQPTIPISKP
eukprot:c52290_g1_i1 orf=17-166(-)